LNRTSNDCLTERPAIVNRRANLISEAAEPLPEHRKARADTEAGTRQQQTDQAHSPRPILKMRSGSSALSTPLKTISLLGRFGTPAVTGFSLWGGGGRLGSGNLAWGFEMLRTALAWIVLAGVLPAWIPFAIVGHSRRFKSTLRGAL
jgi:hypothetical protein